MKRTAFLKKALLLTLVVAMLTQTFMIAGFAASDDDNVTTYNAVIMNVKGGASAIATMTFDDGVHSTNEILLELMKKYDLGASLMVVSTRAGGANRYYSSVEQLTELIKGGYLEVQSHSYSHLYIAPEGHGDYKPENCTDENRVNEIYNSKVWLQDNFPGTSQISFAVPGGSYDDEALKLVMNNFYASRTGNSNASVSNIQSLNPEDTYNGGGWYYLRNLWLTESRVTSGALSEYLQACINNGGWFITGCHNVTTDATKLGTGNNDITVETFDAFLAELKAYEDDGKVWVATFSEATKYLREYQNSTVNQYKNEQGMFVELTMSETTERGMALDAATFNMPLTVKLEIPEGWERVRLLQDGEETFVTSFVEGGKTYAYADIVPNSAKVSVSNADEEIPTQKIKSELTLAKGGASAIASMTFDDGLMATARTLNELCAKYGLKASLMMITDKIDAPSSSAYSTAEWLEVFGQGYLVPESHSATHLNVKDHNQTAEELEVEIGGSLTTLKTKFPQYDSLTFAVPNSNYTAKEYEYVMKYFYAARGGSCVIDPRYNNSGNMMTLNPTMGHSINSWYNPSMARMQANSVPDYITVDSILQYLTKCVNNNGWFISICHGIDEGSNPDMTRAQMEEIFAAMKYYQDAGKLWVATYSEATKYVRERQNSTVNAYQLFDNIYVDLTMKDTTEDGLALDADVFNMPLTVKIELPDNWGRFTYRQGSGAEKVAYTVKEGGVRFAYIDLVPNGGTAILSNEGDPTDYVASLGMKQNVSSDTSLSYNIYIPSNSSVVNVYNGKRVLAYERLDNGYTKYTVGDIDITDIDQEFNFSLRFHESTGYADYSFNKSIISYLGDLIASPDATEKDKQLVYDFAVYAKASVAKFADKPTAVTQLNEIISSLSELGYKSTESDETLSDMGTMDKVFNGAAFAINEKPYYVFYVNEGYTGDVTLSYGEGENAVSVVYNIVNGYYHCQRYIIFEVENVYELTSEISIKAEVAGADGATVLDAEGAYSMANFIDGLTADGKAPEYESALYSYALSAKNYNAD